MGHRSGAAAVEFAVVAPVFLLMLIAMLAYGIYLGAAHGTAQLAADAARAAVAGLSDAERVTIAEDHIRRNAGSYPLLDASRVSVVAGPLPGDVTQFRVAVRFDATNLPIWGFANLIPLPESTIERVATIKRGGY
ncbi:MAG: TadE/TadG family type IV pilus assembly protein [Hyphomicrobiaceae bacterium]|nr:TadE/TadG family type IV pilus assembly protein [Hyphomicrobiaceae bacterium]